MLRISLALGLAVLGGFTLGLLYLGLELYACMKAWQGEWYALPLVGRLALRVHSPDQDPSQANFQTAAC